MAQSTVSAGYAQSDYQGVANKANGFNLKYRYEDGSNPLGWIGSFTYTEKIALKMACTTKVSTTASPVVRLTV